MEKKKYAVHADWYNMFGSGNEVISKHVRRDLAVAKLRKIAKKYDSNKYDVTNFIYDDEASFTLVSDWHITEVTFSICSIWDE